ncbi:MAG: hypothetical protein ACOCVC_07680, partial [Spirochaeta sp.]
GYQDIAIQIHAPLPAGTDKSVKQVASQRYIIPSEALSASVTVSGDDYLHTSQTELEVDSDTISGTLTITNVPLNRELLVSAEVTRVIENITDKLHFAETSFVLSDSEETTLTLRLRPHKEAIHAVIDLGIDYEGSSPIDAFDLSAREFTALELTASGAGPYILYIPRNTIDSDVAVQMQGPEGDIIPDEEDSEYYVFSKPGSTDEESVPHY